MVLPNGKTYAEHTKKKIELMVRKCYKSEGKMTEDSYKTFLKAIAQTRRHTGIVEHGFVSVTFVTDRGVSHEAVRHRMASYLQESTRYCDYSEETGKHPGVTYIMPPWLSEGTADFNAFVVELGYDDERYEKWRGYGWPPEQARYFLPQGVKTEYAATLNLGSWWNFLSKRTAPEAHPQIRQLALPLLGYFQDYFPEFFSNIHTVAATPYKVSPGMFVHKDKEYSLAKLVVNPYYDQVPFEVVYQS
jgi:thymidylate synthase (FAD)